MLAWAGTHAGALCMRTPSRVVGSIWLQQTRQILLSYNLSLSNVLVKMLESKHHHGRIALVFAKRRTSASVSCLHVLI